MKTKYLSYFFFIFLFFSLTSCGTDSTKVAYNVDQINTKKSVVILNENLLKGDLQTLSTKKLTLTLPDGQEITLIRDKIEYRKEGFTWFGKIDGDNLSSVIITFEKNVGYGTIQFNNKIYKIKPLEPSESKYIIEDYSEMDTPNFENDAVPINLPQKKIEKSQYVNKQNTVYENGSKVDVLILYTTAIKNDKGTGLDSFLQNLIDVANTSLNNSQINTVLVLVGKVEFNQIDETQDLKTALDNLSKNQTAINLKNQYKADIVVLVRKYNGSSVCGKGYMIQKLNQNFQNDLDNIINFYKDYAFAVADIGTYGSSVCHDTTFAHEVGHIFGCNHDRDHTTVEGAFSYSYGHDQPGVFATIMSYDNPTIKYFSNPNVLYNNQPTGIPEGQPNSADNAKTINNTRIIVSNFFVNTQQGNSPPNINSFQAKPDSGEPPLNVTFDINVSDPDGDSITCRIDVDSDGNIDYEIKSCSKNSQNHTYSNENTYKAKLIITDGNYTVEKTVTITVSKANNNNTNNTTTSNTTIGGGGGCSISGYSALPSYMILMGILLMRYFYRKVRQKNKLLYKFKYR